MLLLYYYILNMIFELLYIYCLKKLNQLTEENIKCEAARLEAQAKNLLPVPIPGHPDVTIECVGYPTLGQLLALYYISVLVFLQESLLLFTM